MCSQLCPPPGRGTPGTHTKPGWWPWLGFGGTQVARGLVGLVVELFLALSLPSIWERSQPRCWALTGEQARAAVEVLPVAKELHVFMKTLNRQCFLRQCRVALASYRHWHWNHGSLCSLVREKLVFSRHFHNIPSAWGAEIPEPTLLSPLKV